MAAYPQRLVFGVRVAPRTKYGSSATRRSPSIQYYTTRSRCHRSSSQMYVVYIVERRKADDTLLELDLRTGRQRFVSNWGWGLTSFLRRGDDSDRLFTHACVWRRLHYIVYVDLSKYPRMSTCRAGRGTRPPCLRRVCRMWLTLCAACLFLKKNGTWRSRTPPNRNKL